MRALSNGNNSLPSSNIISSTLIIQPNKLIQQQRIIGRDHFGIAYKGYFILFSTKINNF